MPQIRAKLTNNRNAMREQFELQFAPELAKLNATDRKALVAAGDVMTQPISIDYLHRDRELSSAQMRKALTGGLTALLG